MILTKVFCTSGPNLVVLTWMGDELSRGKAHNWVNFDFDIKFDLEGQGQSPPKTIGMLTKVFYIYGTNLVILAWTCDELSRGQASAYRTHRRTNGHTDRQNQATTIPEGQNWPRVKRGQWCQYTPRQQQLQNWFHIYLHHQCTFRNCQFMSEINSCQVISNKDIYYVQ